MTFASLNLIPELLRAVEAEGYTEPTPIQAQAIPLIIGRHDIMGCAQTGTGKTAGFTLPLLQRLAPSANSSTSPARHPVLALVLTPTRELAVQVEASIKTYGKYLPLRATCLYGGVDIKPQIKALQQGVEIIVATPGRLLDHLQGKTINLSQVQILVLDEADRMLDMGFMPDIKRILATLPEFRQTLLFSATFSDEIKKLAAQIMRNPTMVEVARRNSPTELVTHNMYAVPADEKHRLLAHLVKSRDMQQVLVFGRMKRDADKLARQLQKDGLSADAIHSDRSQSERMQALEDFKAGKTRILVATDIAARGLDIDQLPFVINYELPNTAEDYVHRIGRTGRAGTPGEAISLVSPSEMEYLAAIEKLLKRPITRIDLPELGGERKRSAAPRTAVEVDGARPARTPRTEPGERAERPVRREERDVNRARPRPTYGTPPAAPVSQYPHFDFSKPYETPATHTTEADVAAAAAAVPAPRGPAPKRIGALLGGMRNREKV